MGVQCHAIRSVSLLSGNHTNLIKKPITFTFPESGIRFLEFAGVGAAGCGETYKTQGAGKGKGAYTTNDSVIYENEEGIFPALPTHRSQYRNPGSPDVVAGGITFSY